MAKQSESEVGIFERLAARYADVIKAQRALVAKEMPKLEANNARLQRALAALPATTPRFEWLRHRLFAMKDLIRKQKKLIAVAGRKSREISKLMFDPNSFDHKAVDQLMRAQQKVAGQMLGNVDRLNQLGKDINGGIAEIRVLAARAARAEKRRKKLTR